jgi:hypothetical protein
LADGVVHIDEGQPVDAGQQPRHPLGQVAQQPRVDRVQLPHMPEGERAQESPERGGRPHPGEQLAHAAVPQHAQVIDAVGASQHPGDHGRRLDRRTWRRHAQAPTEQVM